jgi:hypothetical protein
MTIDTLNFELRDDYWISILVNGRDLRDILSEHGGFDPGLNLDTIANEWTIFSADTGGTNRLTLAQCENLRIYHLGVPTAKLFPPKPTMTFPNSSHEAARQVGWSKMPAG